MSDEESNPGLPPSEHPDFKGVAQPAAFTFPMKLRTLHTRMMSAVGHDDKLNTLCNLLSEITTELIAREES